METADRVFTNLGSYLCVEEHVLVEEHESPEHDCGLHTKTRHGSIRGACAVKDASGIRKLLNGHERNIGERKNKLWKHNGPAGRRELCAWMTGKDTVIHRPSIGESVKPNKERAKNIRNARRLDHNTSRRCDCSRVRRQQNG